MSEDSTNSGSAPDPENAAQPSEQPETPAGAQLDPGDVATTSSEEAAPATDNAQPEQQLPQTTPPYATAAPSQDNESSAGGVIAGAGAIVSLVLAAMSLPGNPLTELLRNHKALTSELDQSPDTDQIDTAFTLPWHTVALSNGIIAVVAVLLGGVVLAAWLQARSAKWAKAVALSGMILGVIGVLIAAGTYFDLFVTPPEMPEQPQMPGMP